MFFIFFKYNVYQFGIHATKFLKISAATLFQCNSLEYVFLTLISKFFSLFMA